MLELAQEQYRHRALIVNLIIREFRLRYLGSLMGRYWNFIHPLAMVSLYTFIFSYIMQVRFGGQNDTLAYAVYLCAGLLPWQQFQEGLLRGSSQFRDWSPYLKKTIFPRKILPAVVSGSSLLGFSISMLLYLCLVLWYRGPNTALIYLPLLMLLQSIFISGLGILLGIANVFLRDIQQGLTLLLQLWFWATPIVYRIDQVPGWLQPYYYFNPFFYFSKSYQNILFHGQAPEITSLAICSSLSLIAIYLGSHAWQRFEYQVLDEL